MKLVDFVQTVSLSGGVEICKCQTNILYISVYFVLFLIVQGLFGIISARVLLRVTGTN